MAVKPGESDVNSALFERIMIGMGFAVFAALEAAGGGEHAIVAGFFAGATIFVLRRSSESARQAADFAVDFLAVATFTLLCDRAGLLWRSPETFAELFRLSPVGAATATILYLAGVVTLRARSRMAVRAALFVLPLQFSLLIALGSPPVTQIGGALLLGLDVPEAFRKIVGHTLVLFLLNESIVVGIPLALGRFLPRQWRPHSILFASAFVASLTPYIAPRSRISSRLICPIR
jgi:cyclic beta-1,2-glucan synthetase